MLGEIFIFFFIFLSMFYPIFLVGEIDGGSKKKHVAKKKKKKKWG